MFPFSSPQHAYVEPRRPRSSGNCPPILVTMTEYSPEKFLRFFDNKDISADKQQFSKCHVEQESLGRQVSVIRLLRLARVKSCCFRCGNFLLVDALAKESFFRKNFFNILADQHQKERFEKSLDFRGLTTAHNRTPSNSFILDTQFLKSQRNH